MYTVNPFDNPTELSILYQQSNAGKYIPCKQSLGGVFSNLCVCPFIGPSFSTSYPQGVIIW